MTAVAGTPPGAAGDVDSERTLAHLADDVLPLLITRLGASGLGELEVRQNGWRVRLRRNLHPPAPAGPVASGRSPSAKRPAERRPDGPGRADGSPEARTRRERGRLAITATAVGYYQPRDDLSVGLGVRAGDLLGHVDVLGVRQDVVAPESGIIAALSAQAGEAVEYGQLLARLEPEDRG